MATPESVVPQHRVPLALQAVGIWIILGTAACVFIFSVPEGLAAAGEERSWRRDRSKPDHHRDQHERRIQDHEQLAPWMREQQSGRQEQRGLAEESSEYLVVTRAQNKSEESEESKDEPRLQLQQDDDAWVANGADDVWLKLVAAESPARQDRCLCPPCGEGKHIHDIWVDFGDEMAHVQGAVVVRRPGLAKSSDCIAPANTLDFVATLQSYFAVFNSSLLPTKMIDEGHTSKMIQEMQQGRFFGAVSDGDTAAGRYLSSYYTQTEVPKPASDGYEGVPTVASMADVYINSQGFFWNGKNYVVPKSCHSEINGPAASVDLPTSATRYEKVVDMASHWGYGYFHFVIEVLPRIMLVLDMLLEHEDIKIAVRAPENYSGRRKQYFHGFLELLGLDRERIIFVDDEPIFAELAIVPESVGCGKPNTALTSLLRTALLQAMYPSTGGVPPLLPRPTIVLIVRETKRGLANNGVVRDALQQNFSGFDVLEFSGEGTTLSQLQMFATASIVVAPHGAGLANVVVSSLHTPVLEIAPFMCPPCYLNLSLKLQHVYGRHPSGNSLSEACETWYEPDPDEVVDLVRDLLAAKRLADSADPPAP